MSNNLAIIIVVIAVILIGGWLLLRDGGTSELTTGEDAVIEQQIEELRVQERSGVVTRSTAAREGEATLMVDAVSFLTPGFVVVRTDENGTPGDVLGASGRLTGFSEDVSVTLSRTLTEGEIVYVVL